MNVLDTMKQALSEMEKQAEEMPCHYDAYFEAMNDLRAAIEQYEAAEPVAEVCNDNGPYVHWIKEENFYERYPEGTRFYTAPAVPEVKPHQIAALVNELRGIAIKYHDHQSLRERLAGPVHELWKGEYKAVPEGHVSIPVKQLTEWSEAIAERLAAPEPKL